MANFLKKIIYKLFGQKNYLKILHHSFFFMYDSGMLKDNYIYKYHYFVKHLVREGNSVVDLGANLGYFSKIFSRLVGRSGKVYSIEPVKPFFKVLKWGLKKYPQCTQYNYALGTEERTIEMTVPRQDGYLRTGLSHVSDEENDASKNYIFKVEMVRGSQLLADIPRIDYIKCDIEGYEEYVLPEMKNIIDKHKPYLQVETWPPHKNVVVKLMEELGYLQYTLHEGKLVKNLPDGVAPGDYLFIHSSKEQSLIDDLRPKGLI